ncbi:hypothetical protein V9T40_002763 [Parthenolecanium corni]|uniref:WASH complex subunit CCDC53 n=1 Tax=Parthenolecanium corni TaxID=536013 RepID=A0AAN9Y5N8_9HEMI
MDLQKIPPIQQKRIVTFVNNFIIDTVSFLNKFINASENTLWKLEKRMRKLDTTLKLLEAKLNFIPDAETISPPNGASTSSNEKCIEPVSESKEMIDEKENQEVDSVNEENENKDPVNEVPEEVQKYIKMVKVGVPVEAVKLKMKNDNIDPALLKL